MDESEKLVLGDKNIFPSDDLLFSIFGDKKVVWEKIMSYVNENYKNITSEWRYYNDGKQWLFKMQQKKKTIFWVGVLKDTFRITFYFGNKAEPVIVNSNLPAKIKDDFLNGKRFGSIRAISTAITGPGDLEDIYKLNNLRVNLP